VCLVVVTGSGATTSIKQLKTNLKLPVMSLRVRDVYRDSGTVLTECPGAENHQGPPLEESDSCFDSDCCHCLQA
jgi:hypothetical protein